MENNSRIIRKIIIGRDPKNALAYMLGSRAGQGEVVEIIVDERSLALNNIKRYIIYIQKGDDIIPWKSIEGMPVIVEYDCDFE